MNLSRVFAGIALMSCLAFSVGAHAAGDPDQSLMLALQVTRQHITIKHAVLRPYPFVEMGNASSAPQAYRYIILSKDNRELYSGSFGDPHDVITEDFSGPSIRGRKEHHASVEVLLDLPYFPDAARIRFEREESGKRTALGTAPLTPVKPQINLK